MSSEQVMIMKKAHPRAEA